MAITIRSDRHIGRHFEKMAQYFELLLTPLKSCCDGLYNGMHLVLIFQPVTKLDGACPLSHPGINVMI